MKQQSITNLPPSPGDERHTRMVKYAIAMTIRVICIVLMLFLHGWWLVLPAIGAIVLPYFAVILASVGAPTKSVVNRPGGVVALPGGARPPRDFGGRPE